MALGRKTGGRVKGVSVNKNTGIMREMAQVYGPAAIAKLAQLAGLIKGTPGSEQEGVQVQALRELLDRGYGKPAQAVTGADGGNMVIQIVTGVLRDDDPDEAAEVDTGVARDGDPED